MRLRWHPQPELRGQVWIAINGDSRLEVRRMEEGLNTFGATLNGKLLGAWASPLQAIEQAEKVVLQ